MQKYIKKVKITAAMILLKRKNIIMEILKIGDSAENLEAFLAQNLNNNHNDKIETTEGDTNNNTGKEKEDVLSCLFDEIQGIRKKFDFTLMIDFYQAIDKNLANYSNIIINDKTLVEDMSKLVDGYFEANKANEPAINSSTVMMPFKDDMFVYKLDTIIIVS